MACEHCPTLKRSSHKSCAYHPAGTELHGLTELGPPGVPPEMYYALYPLCFSYIYGARMPQRSVLVRCPTNEFVSYLITRRPPSLLMRLKNVAKTFLSVLRPWAREVCDIDITPNQVLPGWGSRRSQRFNLNGRFKYLCPAAFSSLFPQILAMLRDGRMTGAGREVRCPDHVVDQRFSYATVQDSKGSKDHCCSAFTGVELVALGENQHQGAAHSLSAILNECGSKCFSAYQVLVPYYLALAGGGTLGFYTKNNHSAMVQCPGINNTVQFLISRDSFDGRIYHKVVNVRGRCPLGYVKGDRGELSGAAGFSPYLLYVAYLYAMCLLDADSVELICFSDPLSSRDEGLLQARRSVHVNNPWGKGQTAIPLCVANA